MCAGQAVAPTLLSKHCDQASHSPEISLMKGEKEEGAGEWWGRAEAGRICITTSPYSYRPAIMSDSSFFSPSETFWVWPSFVLIQKVWSFLAFLHAVRFTFKLSYSDNNILSVSHVGDCTLVWRKDSSLKMSVSMDYSRGHRFIMYILLMVTPASRRMPFTSQTPHFQAGFLIHPNSRQKALLRKAGSFSNYYHYSTNLTKDLILLLKILLFDSALEDFSWAILKNWLFRRPLTIFIWCPFLFFVILRRSVGVLGSPRDSEPKMAQGVVGGEGREGEHAPGFWNMLFRTYMCNNEVFPCLLKLIKVKNKS